MAERLRAVVSLVEATWADWQSIRLSELLYAQAATGKMKPAEAMKWAADQYKQAAAKL